MKGSTELKQKIIAAAKEARKQKEYPVELKIPECAFIQEKFGDTHGNRPLEDNHGTYPHLERTFLSIISLTFFFNFSFCSRKFKQCRT